MVCVYSLGSYHICVIIPGIYYILDASFKSGRTDRVLDGHVIILPDINYHPEVWQMKNLRPTATISNPGGDLKIKSQTLLLGLGPM